MINGSKGVTKVRTASRSTGGVVISDSSRTPVSASWSVRGIGVADSVSTWTSARSSFSRSLWATPKCCSSSTTTRPRSRNLIVLPRSAWVPTTMSTVPSASPALTFFISAAGTKREAWAIFDRQPAEALREGAVMLARQERRRHDDRDLLAGDRRREGGAQRDLGLAEADIAADEPVHRPPDAEVVEDGVDRVLLVLGLLVGEAGRELVVEPFRRGEGAAPRAGCGRRRSSSARPPSRGCAASSAPCAPARRRRRAGRAGPRPPPSRSGSGARCSRPAGTAGRRRGSGSRGSHAARPPPRSSSAPRSGRCRGRHGRRGRRA